MSVELFENAIVKHTFRPKGVYVGYELFNELKRANKIEKKRADILGIESGLSIYFWFYDKDIFVYAIDFIDPNDFKLPKKTT